MTRPILIVEDDDDIRDMMSTLLELSGHRVVTASNGAEALTLAAQHLPALIFLDLMMPVMTGEQFRQAQIANPAIKDIPIVVVSAHHEAARIASRMNALVCLDKPLDIDQLLTVCAAQLPGQQS